MVLLQDIIKAIESKQVVLNRSDLASLCLSFKGVSTLQAADAEQLSFLAQPKYIDQLKDTQSGLVLVSQKFADQALVHLPKQRLLIVKDAYLAYACISTLFVQDQPTDIDATALIDPSASLGKNVSIGAYSIVGKNAIIGDNVRLGSHVIIGDGVVIGDDSFIDNQVNIAHDCRLGNQVRIHSHASIGSEGFGFAPNLVDGVVQWQRIAQLGRVVIGNRVRIGSNTCIDRGAVGDTVIDNDVIIDNLVQIAHNVHIGAGTAMAAKVAIAGSTVVGKNCVIGGAVGINGHLKIADNVTITAMSMVISDIQQAGSYSSGTVAMPSANWRRAALRFRQSGEKSN